LSAARQPGWARAGVGLGLVGALGCFEGRFLAGRPCVEDRDCGPALTCEQGICGGYQCPLELVDGICPCPGPETFTCTALTGIQTKIDVVFVIDDTSIAGQRALTELSAAWIERLDLQLADYRIAVTTTDHGNPWCSSEAEAGAFVLSSCLERLDDFVTNSAGNERDERQLCLDRCAHATLTTLPSTVAGDPDPSPRPWLEVGPTATNMAEGIPTREALDCLLLQGIAGCGFEQPLESLYAGLARAEDPLDPNFGFVRDDAHLLVVIVSDASDCSYNPIREDVFAADGDKTFWSDPTAAAPTPALCWNAGVVCSGDPDAYTDCEPANLDLFGAPTSNPNGAVLHPVDRYTNQLRALAASKRAVDAELEVVLAIAAGVPTDDDESSGYASDPAFDDEYGIGPGCTSDAGFTAQPPVRMLALVEGLDDDYSDSYSLCEDHLGGAVTAINSDLGELLPAQCAQTCVADQLSATPGVQGDCAVARVVDGELEPVPACVVDGEGQPVLGPGSLCYYTREGAQLSASCRARGWNLQFGFLSADGSRIPEPIYASCERSADPVADCGPDGGR
jgi:hypothetical protein